MRITCGVGARCVMVHGGGAGGAEGGGAGGVAGGGAGTAPGGGLGGGAGGAGGEKREEDEKGGGKVSVGIWERCPAVPGTRWPVAGTRREISDARSSMHYRCMCGSSGGHH